jgi:hypothetical protein
MKRVFGRGLLGWVLLVAFVGVTSSQASEGVIPVRGLRDLFTGRMVKTEGAALYVVTRPDCPACARIHGEVECLKDGLFRALGKEVALYLVATGEANPALQRAYRKLSQEERNGKKVFRVLTAPEGSSPQALVFSATPGVLAVDADGKQVLRFQGFKSCSNALKGLPSRHPTTEFPPEEEASLSSSLSLR